MGKTSIRAKKKQNNYIPDNCILSKKEKRKNNLSTKILTVFVDKQDDGEYIHYCSYHNHPGTIGTTILNTRECKTGCKYHQIYKQIIKTSTGTKNCDIKNYTKKKETTLERLANRFLEAFIVKRKDNSYIHYCSDKKHPGIIGPQALKKENCLDNCINHELYKKQ